MADDAFHFFQVKKCSISTLRHTGHTCQTVAVVAGGASVRIAHTLQTVLMAFRTLPLNVVSEVARGTLVHTGAVVGMEVEPSAAGQALIGRPAHAGFTASEASPTTPGLHIPIVAQGALADTGPACLGAAQAEVDAVQTMVSIRTITALVSTFSVARPVILFLLFLCDLLLRLVGLGIAARTGDLQHPGARMVRGVGVVGVHRGAVQDEGPLLQLTEYLRVTVL